MEDLKLPEKVRVRLLGLYQARQMAETALQGPVATALEFLGLDPMLPHSINFDTGIVTPAPDPGETEAASLPEPTPIREEAV